MKKKILSLLCAVALLAGVLGLFPATRAVSTTVYLLAANDKFCDLPGGTLPVAVNGTIYIPYTVFDKDATGVDFGVYYGIKQDQGLILNLYSQDKLLSFAVNQGICTDGDGNTMNYRAVIRNNIPYIPAMAVCSFFGLRYSFLPTSDRGTLIRVCTSSATLNDSTFLNVGATQMLTRYNNVLQSMETQISLPISSPTPPPTATPSPTPVPTPPVSSPPVPSAPPPATKEHVQVYLAVDASEAGANLLTLFSDDIRALFLFTPDSLSAQSALVRKAVAAGHSVGLIVAGTGEEIAQQLEEGNRLLSHIARIRTRIVSAPKSQIAALTREGWLCWQSTVTGTTASALISGLDRRRAVGHLTLPGSVSVVRPVLEELRSRRYDVRQPLETAGLS